MPTWNWELLVLFWGCRGWLFGHYLEFGLWPRFLPSLVSPSDPPQGVPEARVHLAVCPSSPGPGHSLLRHLPELHGGRDACLQEGGAWGCQLRPSCALAVKRCLPVCVCVCVCCAAVARAALVWEAERQGCVWAASIALPAGWRHLTSLWRTESLAPCLLPQRMRLWAPAGPAAAPAPPAWTLGCDGDVPRAHHACLTAPGPLPEEWM